MEESNPILGEQFKKIVWNQINSNNPPMTKVTYNRLLSEGIEKEEVIRLLACVVSTETYNVLKFERPFDLDAYEKMLLKLPKMPWE
ncbi:MAG: hypothetical protein JW913_01075 [Chitinispirillaceae bacterium]|nr:hypothetical protein [Chitinispirillaceae bacterium]